MEDHKIYIHAFISACITIFIPMFVWGNIIAFLPWLVNKLNLLDSSLGFLFMLFANSSDTKNNESNKKINLFK